MTGPEHYREAEHILAGVTLGEHPDGAPIFRHDEPEMFKAAQVHATLALAAATALGGSTEHGLPTPDWQAWYDAAADRQEATRG